jgi:hypothetical protein
MNDVNERNKPVVKDKAILNVSIKHYQDLDTGELIEATEVVKKVGRQGFMITYLSAIINLIEVMGNKKMQVVKYILSNMELANNILIITTRELAIKSKVGHNTVIDTLRILENAGIIKRRTGSIMVNSSLVHRGNENKERLLVARFLEFNEDVVAEDD